MELEGRNKAKGASFPSPFSGAPPCVRAIRGPRTLLRWNPARTCVASQKPQPHHQYDRRGRGCLAQKINVWNGPATESLEAGREGGMNCFYNRNKTGESIRILPRGSQCEERHRRRCGASRVQSRSARHDEDSSASKSPRGVSLAFGRR